jgi:SAM-dependent methyltransferase
MNQWSWEQSVAWLRQQPDQQALVRACYYDDPLLSAVQRYARSDEWRAVRILLPRSAGRVLDVGAGRGISSYALAKNGWQVVALEPDPSPLVGAEAIRGLAQEANLPIVVTENYGETMPFEDGVFDLVYEREVLHHARDLGRLCQESARVLKPGGRLLITRETVISRSEDLEIFLKRHPLHAFFGGENAFLLEDYLTAISACGLRILKVFGPLDSPINFYPIDDEVPGVQASQRFARKVRRLLIRWLYPARSALVRSLPRPTAHRLFKVLDSPGRLFSFVACKPM